MAHNQFWESTDLIDLRGDLTRRARILRAESPEDAVQDTMARLFKSYPEHAPHDLRLLGYIVLKRTIIDEARAAKNRYTYVSIGPTSSAGSEGTVAQELASDCADDDPMTVAERRDFQRWVEGYTDHLSERDRSIVEAVVFDPNATTTSISRAHHVSRNTVPQVVQAAADAWLADSCVR